MHAQQALCFPCHQSRGPSQKPPPRRLPLNPPSHDKQLVTSRPSDSSALSTAWQMPRQHLRWQRSTTATAISASPPAGYCPPTDVFRPSETPVMSCTAKVTRLTLGSARRTDTPQPAAKQLSGPSACCQRSPCGTGNRCLAAQGRRAPGRLAVAAGSSRHRWGALKEAARCWGCWQGLLRRENCNRNWRRR